MKSLLDLHRRRITVLEKLIIPVKAAIATLRDLKMESNAKPLEEIIFELDVINQELDNLVKEHPEEILQFLIRGIEGGKL